MKLTLITNSFCLHFIIWRMHKLGAGNISQDTLGRWYINITIKVARAAQTAGKAELGISVMTLVDGL